MVRCLLVGFVLLTAADAANAQDAERLYEAGAFRAAADSFSARAAAHPGVPANWYNLGNALFRAGEEGRARAAWLHAARQDPRNRTISDALNLVPPPDITSADATRIPLATPGEVLALAVLTWVVAWVMVGLRRPWRHVLPVMLVAGTVAILGASKIQEYRRPLALIRHANTAIRSAPYASANARRSLNMGATVELVRRYAGWYLVRRGNDQGWVLSSELVSIGH